MTLPEVLASAIRGGYQTTETTVNRQVLLDISFWRSLARDQNWTQRPIELNSGGYMPEWKYHLISLVFHLSNGGTIAEYFSTL